MIWIFVVGLAFTYIFTQKLKRWFPAQMTDVRRFLAVHFTSMVATAVLSAFGLSAYGQSYSMVYFLVCSYFPQMVWIIVDVCRFSLVYLKAPSVARGETAGQRKRSLKERFYALADEEPAQDPSAA